MGTWRRLVAVLTLSFLASGGRSARRGCTLLAVTDPSSPSSAAAGDSESRDLAGHEAALAARGIADRAAARSDQADRAAWGSRPSRKTDPAAAETEPDRDYRYLAVIAGACDRLVVGDREVPICADKLVNVDFGNGRVAFMFTGRVGDTTVITTFSGGASEQPGARTYHLAIDRMSTTTVGADTAPATVVVATEGDCTMAGDPTREETRFECHARSDGKETLRALSDDRQAGGLRGDPPQRRSGRGSERRFGTSARLALLVEIVPLAIPALAGLPRRAPVGATDAR